MTKRQTILPSRLVLPFGYIPFIFRKNAQNDVKFPYVADIEPVFIPFYAEPLPK